MNGIALDVEFCYNKWTNVAHKEHTIKYEMSIYKQKRTSKFFDALAFRLHTANNCINWLHSFINGLLNSGAG
jgi:hypothetical protein